MDEVDGMSIGDKGGNAELCRLIPNAKVNIFYYISTKIYPKEIPIICICNDREKDSVRTLAKYCVDIRFSR